MIPRRFSEKQRTLLSWWCPDSPYANHTAILCDGAVRSGKTLCMSLSFVLWAFSGFSEEERFAFCGKTIASLRRNLLAPLRPLLLHYGFQWEEQLSRNRLLLSYGKDRREFYLFGGRDESSAGLIQGITLAGVLLDEAALMPRSFVEQALARCSSEQARFWFNCNPEHPYHWLYQEWICKAAEKNALRLHFELDDNPSLSEKVKARYRSLYSGAFYERFILGKWVRAEGLVYPFFSERHQFKALPAPCAEWVVSCDYGTVNPTSMGLWGRCGDVWYRTAEYYFDSRREQASRTDEEHYAALEQLAGGLPIRAVVADPSAASFLETIRRKGRFPVIPAKNEVLDGIRRVSSALQEGRIRISSHCADSIREFGLYAWEENTALDRPKKEHDHAMDDIRYFVSTILDPQPEDFAAFILLRETQPAGDSSAGTAERRSF